MKKKRENQKFKLINSTHSKMGIRSLFFSTLPHTQPHIDIPRKNKKQKRFQRKSSIKN